LQKDPARRFASAEDLANDLRCFLAGTPIKARSAGPVERFWRWYGRNRALAALLVFVALSLVLGTAFSVREAILADDEAERARQSERAAEAARRLADDARGDAERNAGEARKAAEREREAHQQADKERQGALAARARAEREVHKFKISQEILADSFDDPVGVNGGPLRVSAEAGKNRRVYQLLAHGQERLARRNDLGPEDHAAVLEACGNGYRNLSLYNEAEGCFVQEYKLLNGRPDVELLDLAVCEQSLGRFYHERGLLERDATGKNDYDKAHEYYGLALKKRGEKLPACGRLYCESKFHLAWMQMELEEFAEAKRLFSEIIQFYKESPERKDRHDDRLLALARTGLACAGVEEGLASGKDEPTAIAIALFEGASRLLELEGDDAWRRAFTLLRNGIFLKESAKIFGGKARRLAIESLRECEAIIHAKDPDHFYRTIPLFFLGSTLEEDGQVKEADLAYKQFLKAADRSVGLEHTQVVTAMKTYALFLHKEKRTAEAHDLFKQLIAAAEKRFGESHFFVAHAKLTYATFLQRIGDYTALEQQCKDAGTIYAKMGWQQHARYQKSVDLWQALP
jgi:tetratricopeptide (TPR) repeat protein